MFCNKKKEILSRILSRYYAGTKLEEDRRYLGSRVDREEKLENFREEEENFDRFHNIPIISSD